MFHQVNFRRICGETRTVLVDFNSATERYEIEMSGQSVAHGTSTGQMADDLAAITNTLTALDFEQVSMHLSIDNPL